MVPAYLQHLLLPPANLFLLFLLAWLIARWRPRLGRFLMGLAIVGLYALSTPYVGGTLIHGVQSHPALNRYDHNAGAIVVLSGGNVIAAEYGGETLGSTSLARVRYGAYLHRLTGLPLLVSGGRAHDDHPSEGEAMARVLEQSFGVAPRWIEIKATDTYDNARNSAAILHPLGIMKIYLVTSGSHMRRAAASFDSIGFDVIPAPTNLAWAPVLSARSLIPNAKSIYASATAMHEWLGLLWYRWSYF